MSRGDLIKRENNSRIMRIRSQEEELKEMTFKPSISKKAKAGNSSQVSLARDTAKFLEVAREKAKQRETQRLQALENREKEALSECTFAPATKDCPAYVRRIAKSMAVVRAARTTQVDAAETDQKPTWK
jgi:hypothetical protein